ARLEGLGAHALDLDYRPLQLQVEGSPGAPHQGQSNLGARRPAHPLHRINQAHALDRVIVDLDDQIARLDAGPGRGSVVDWRNDLDETVFLTDLDAQPAELAGGGVLQALEGFRLQIGRMWIQPLQHAADGVFQQRGIV